MKGGPALHIEDKQLLLKKSLDRESLITVRRGEPVFSLEENRPEWATTEIIKLKGTNGLMFNIPTPTFGMQFTEVLGYG
jgi:hypothetical protein